MTRGELDEKAAAQLSVAIPMSHVREVVRVVLEAATEIVRTSCQCCPEARDRIRRAIEAGLGDEL